MSNMCFSTIDIQVKRFSSDKHTYRDGSRTGPISSTDIHKLSREKPSHNGSNTSLHNTQGNTSDNPAILVPMAPDVVMDHTFGSMLQKRSLPVITVFDTRKKICVS